MTRRTFRFASLLGLFMLLVMGAWYVIARNSLAPEAAEWAWVGAVTDTRATVVAQAAVGELTLALERDGADPAAAADARRTVEPSHVVDAGGGRVARFELAGLLPGTRYFYHLTDPRAPDRPATRGTFRTFPAADVPASFRFAVSSCCRNDDSPTFAAIARQRPLFFLHTGDFHYENIADNNPTTFHAAFSRQLRAPHQGALYRGVPIAYVWDDHDFGPDNSTASNPSKSAAHRNYRDLVPHYPLRGDADEIPIDQAFTVGRVRFILSDLRTRRNAVKGTIIDPAQMHWLKAELLATKGTHPLVFWVSGIPWNGPEKKPGGWQAYAEQRREIADFIKANGLTGVCVLSGDAHMTAIDDGSNSDFATDGGAPLRVFQAGPLWNYGSYKGGPYSHGARSEGWALRQFGIVDVVDDGHRIVVRMSGRDGSDGRGDNVLEAQRDAKGPIEYTFEVNGGLAHRDSNRSFTPHPQSDHALDEKMQPLGERVQPIAAEFLHKPRERIAALVVGKVPLMIPLVILAAAVMALLLLLNRMTLRLHETRILAHQPGEILMHGGNETNVDASIVYFSPYAENVSPRAQ